MLDAFTRLRCFAFPEDDVDDFFPENASQRDIYGDPKGPKLGSILLNDLGIDRWTRAEKAVEHCRSSSLFECRCTTGMFSLDMSIDIGV